MCTLSKEEKKSISEQWECIKLDSVRKMRGIEVKQENNIEVKVNTSVLKPIFYSQNELNPA